MVTIADKYRCRNTTISLNPGETESQKWPLSRTSGWYDLAVTLEGAPAFEYQFAGHVENGRDSVSDPALGGLDCRE